MPDISINRPHTLGFAEAKRRFTQVMAEEGPKNGITGRFVTEDKFTFEATGANGATIIGDKDIAILVDLSFFSRPFKADIEAAINDMLDKTLDGGRGNGGGGKKPDIIRPKRREPEIKRGNKLDRIQPLGPNLAAALARTEKEKPFTKRKKLALLLGGVAGVATVALVPGPLGRVVSGALSGYSAYRLTCDLIGGC